MAANRLYVLTAATALICGGIACGGDNTGTGGAGGSAGSGGTGGSAGSGGAGGSAGGGGSAGMGGTGGSAGGGGTAGGGGAPAATMTGITVTPQAATLNVGQSTDFTAMANYDNGSSVDITTTAVWASSDTNIVDITATGTATAIAVGSAQITAQDSGFTSNAAAVGVQVPLPTPVAGDLIINEFMVNGTVNGDANGDGTVDAVEDEFIELVNVSGTELDLDGVVIFESRSPGIPVRHTFSGVVLPAGEAVVVFGGGDAPVNSAGVQYFAAVNSDSGIIFGLGLLDVADTMTVRAADGTVITTVEYGGATGLIANVDQSLTRDPDLSGGFVPHDTATGANAAIFSPGAKVDGSAFP